MIVQPLLSVWVVMVRSPSRWLELDADRADPCDDEDALTELLLEPLERTETLELARFRLVRMSTPKSTGSPTLSVRRPSAE
jgi:hypothetical protein